MDRITSALEQGRLGATAGVVAVLLLGGTGGPQVVPGVELHHLFGYNLLVISVLLGLRVVVTISRPRGA